MEMMMTQEAAATVDDMYILLITLEVHISDFFIACQNIHTSLHQSGLHRYASLHLPSLQEIIGENGSLLPIVELLCTCDNGKEVITEGELIRRLNIMLTESNTMPTMSHYQFYKTSDDGDSEVLMDFMRYPTDGDPANEAVEYVTLKWVRY
jgi:hypothetical protein